MWRMNSGDRAFTDHEWALFSTGLHELREAVEQDIRFQTDDADTGINVFDRLTPEQKLLLLADIARALRDPNVPTPTHTAANEGAIAGVCSTIRTLLDMELDHAGTDQDEDLTEIRQLLLAIFDGEEGPEDPLPAVDSLDADEWEWLVEAFEARIFWDDDYEMGDEFLDLPPELARERLTLCGIDPAYFLTVPPEPTEAELIAARQTLAQLLGLPVPDDHGLYPTIEDLYHGLVIGPCSHEEIARWEDNSWVQVISMTEPQWVCDFQTWQGRFSHALPLSPFEVNPMAEHPGALSSDVRVERWGSGWVVRDDDGLYWCGLIENCWTEEPNEDDMPALTFPSEHEARAAYAQADQMYVERATRHKQAMTLLGQTQE